MVDKNQEKNKAHYEKVYSNLSIENILYYLKNLDSFLYSATTTEISWFALYQMNFKGRLKGKKVLEMGCGDCTNAAVMAALGAEVYANDLTSSSGEIVKKLNDSFDFEFPVKFIEGDFLENDLPSHSFDFIVGKAFLHHLTIPIEKLFLKETSRLLKTNGEARFFEPAVNSKILDEIRWYIPVNGRPSRIQKKEFEEWRKNDPHPDRTFSSLHWEKAGMEFFGEVLIIPMGTLERFSRFFKRGEKRGNFKRWALRTEKYLPSIFTRKFARSQLIVYKSPK